MESSAYGIMRANMSWDSTAKAGSAAHFDRNDVIIICEDGALCLTAISGNFLRCFLL